VGAGLYSLAKRLINAVSNVIGAALNRVFFSTIAGLQHDAEASAVCFLDFVTYTALFTAPLFAGIAALAPELISVLFGIRWGESAPLLAIMSATGFLTTIGLYNHSVILAFGKPHWQTWLTFIYAVSNVAIFAVAAPFGVIAIAIGYVVRALLLYPLSAGASLRLLPIRVATYCTALMPAIAAATVMFAAILVAKGLMASLLPWQRLATLVPLGLLVYLAAIRIMAPSEMRVFVRTLARRT
jgi:O-antigen/teichoic acid export membrane protein